MILTIVWVYGCLQGAVKFARVTYASRPTKAGVGWNSTQRNLDMLTGVSVLERAASWTASVWVATSPP